MKLSTGVIGVWGRTFHVGVVTRDVLLLLILFLLLHVEDGREEEVEEVVEQTIHSRLLQSLRKLLCQQNVYFSTQIATNTKVYKAHEGFQSKQTGVISLMTTYLDT